MTATNSSPSNRATIPANQKSAEYERPHLTQAEQRAILAGRGIFVGLPYKTDAEKERDRLRNPTREAAQAMPEAHAPQVLNNAIARALTFYKNPKAMTLELSVIARAPFARPIDKETARGIAESIKDNLANGEPPLLHSIIVRRSGEQFEIVEGHHRYMAMRIAGQTSIACNVVAMTLQQARAFWIAQKLARVPVSEADRATQELELAALTTKSEAYP